MERQTRQREAVLDTLAKCGEALTPTEICERARTCVATLNLSTVYRQLKDLVDSGEVMKVEIAGQSTRFEALCEEGRAHSGRGAPHHHHHFHCRSCDRVYPIHKCPGPMRELAPRGFRVEHHDLTLHGRCASCVGAAA